MCNSVAEVLSDVIAVDAEILLSIAPGVSTTSEFEGLAASLVIDKRLVANLKEMNKRPREIAFEIPPDVGKKRESHASEALRCLAQQQTSLASSSG